MNKRETLRKTGILLGSAAAVLIAETARELRHFRIRRYEVEVQGKKPPEESVKLIFLSDLHGKIYGRDNKSLIKAIKREAPDYILVGGDMLTRSNIKSQEDAVSVIEQISAICPVFCANGNHEQKMKEQPAVYQGRYEDYKKRLQCAGAVLLENESADMKMGGLPVTISGLEIPVSCYGHFKEGPLKVSDIKEYIGSPDPSRYQILLAHNPVYMKQYREWGSDLTLCGHLHGGIVRIPGIGGLISPQAAIFPKYSGDIYREGGHVGIVSRGLGNHTVNIRLFNMAEIVAITLKGEE